jgi:murein DD-endopeptidase MepM/ murein hydrolase activator NlpD
MKKNGQSSRSVSRRRWTLIIVPPRPGARTRQLTVSTRSLAATAIGMFALVAGAATWTGETSSLAESRASRLKESQLVVLALRDSVDALHAAAARDSMLPPRGMMMPVNGEISSSFSYSRLHPLLRYFRAHLGADIRAPYGTHIVAPAAARVKSVGWSLGYGLMIELEHTGGVITRFAHCKSARVQAGDQVLEGETIGFVGSSGLATGPHVHFEVLVNGRQVNPITYVAASHDGLSIDRAQGQAH